MSLTAILSTQALAIGARVFAPAATNAFRSRMASRRSTRALYAEADAPALCSARIGRVSGLARELGDRVGGGQNPVWQRGDEGPRNFVRDFGGMAQSLRLCFGLVPNSEILRLAARIVAKIAHS
jgi:hypothetical protein